MQRFQWLSIVSNFSLSGRRPHAVMIWQVPNGSRTERDTDMPDELGDSLENGLCYQYEWVHLHFRRLERGRLATRMSALIVLPDL